MTVGRLAAVALAALALAGCDVRSNVRVELGASPDDDRAAVVASLDGAAADAADDTVDQQLRQLLARTGGTVDTAHGDGTRRWEARAALADVDVLGPATGVYDVTVDDSETATTVTVTTGPATALTQAYRAATDDANMAGTALAATSLSATVDLGGPVDDWQLAGPLADVADVTEDGSTVTLTVDADRMADGTFTVTGQRHRTSLWLWVAAGAAAATIVAVTIRQGRGSPQRPGLQ